MLSTDLHYLAARFARQAQGLDRDLPPPLPGHLADVLQSFAQRAALLEEAAWPVAAAAARPTGPNVIPFCRQQRAAPGGAA